MTSPATRSRLAALLAPLFVFVAVFAFVAPASDAAAAPEGDAAHSTDDGHGKKDKHGAVPTIKQGLITGITSLVVFGIVALILGTQVWPKIAAGLDERNEKITREIEAAELAREQAKDALEQYEKNLAEARAEATRMLEDAKQQQQALSAELRAKADAELTDLRIKARRDIEAAKKAAIAYIYKDAVNLSSAVASKILAREINASDQQRLVDESLGQLDAAKLN